GARARWRRAQSIRRPGRPRLGAQSHGRRTDRNRRRDHRWPQGRRGRRHGRRVRHGGQREGRPGEPAVMKLFDLLLAQRRFIYLLIALVSAVGIWTAVRLPSAIYPELSFQRITIVAEGSALGARQVVFAITRPIEEAISIVPGVQRVRSKSIRGASQIDITF